MLEKLLNYFRKDKQVIIELTDREAFALIKSIRDGSKRKRFGVEGISNKIFYQVVRQLAGEKYSKFKAEWLATERDIGLNTTDFDSKTMREKFGLTPHKLGKLYIQNGGKKCKYCGTRAGLTLDHIVPVSKGGGNRLENLQILCIYCNEEKDDTIIHTVR